MKTNTKSGEFPILDCITIQFPENCRDILTFLLNQFKTIEASPNILLVPEEQLTYISLESPDNQNEFVAKFDVMLGDIHYVPIKNSTGVEKEHPGKYTPLSLEETSKRFLEQQLKVLKVDHAGFNLPWFEQGMHPQILSLREKLKDVCFYHHFPDNLPWDFIFPADFDEILMDDLDYEKEHRPKFELVSFDVCSRPLIQFDFMVNKTYQELKELFPESLFEEELEKVWLYIKNPSPVDICLVMGSMTDGDWGHIFKGCRIW